MNIELGSDRYSVEPLLHERFENLERWRALENDGRWRVDGRGLVGEWLQRSPSLFLKKKLTTPYIWQIRVTRLRPDADFERRFRASHHSMGFSPETFYNFNHWLRVDAADNKDFFEEYPKYLGSGWNGMGDDHWKSFFCTIVRQHEKNWCRLRRSPGYEIVRDTTDLVPNFDYDQPHEMAFAVGRDRIRAYCDNRLLYDYAEPGLYDYAEPGLYDQGYIGLVVWLCVVRFEDMRVFTLLEG